MSTRTFKQIGQAYGGLPTTVTAKIDGVEVFSGQVTTVNQPLPVLPDLSFQIENTLFSWTNDSAFSGTQVMEISVQGSPLLVTNTWADYAVDVPENQGVFSTFYVYEKDGITYTDPLSNEMIDGIPVDRNDDPSLPGQWYWTIMPGSTFQATVNVNASITPPPAP